MNTCPSLELGTILSAMPSCWRSGHLLLDIKNAYDLGFANRLWNRRQAVSLAFQANMSACVARGRGSRAAKREAQILTHRVAMGPGLTFSQATRRHRLQRADALMAEATTEARSVAHHYRVNPHD